MPLVRIARLVLALVWLSPFALADLISHVPRDPNPAPLSLEASDGSLLLSHRQDVLLTGLSGQTRAVLLRGNLAIGTVAFTGKSILNSAPRFAHNNELSSVDVALFAVNTSMPPSERLRRTPTHSKLDAPEDRHFDDNDNSPTPEPPTFALLLPGAAALIFFARRRPAAAV